MADVKYWCSNHTAILHRCRKEECEKWDSDLTCPALSLSVTVNGRREVCYSNGK